MIDDKTKASMEVDIYVELSEPNLDVATIHAVEILKWRVNGTQDFGGSYLSMDNFSMRLDSFAVSFRHRSFDVEAAYEYTFKPKYQ